ncbi:tyrosine-type recombinase/integrase [Treponema primitia]|uniref:tyrosine-type recombinase/integrase n=1 Tax=Treponema primitia TaxID=88058 RepID=UPI0002554E3F|nr:site-specific integrase [Treponema primitia]
MAVKIGKYHLFQRRQDTGTFWYYWFEDDEGKRVQRACGHGCESKRDAATFIENLLRMDLLEEKRKIELRTKTLSDFAQGMFLDGAPHLARWKAKGKILKPQTIAQHRRHLVNYLLPKFGRLTLDKIKPTAVEDYLLEKELSNSCRNTILYTLQLIMREAKRDGLIEMTPEFEPFKRTGKRQDILSSKELTSLFPFDEKELIEIWKRPDDMRKEQDWIALMFGTLFCVTVSAGLRSGEIRALHKEQISIPNSGLVIDRAVDERGQIGSLKKATAEDPRSRAVIIPEITLKMLERWLDRVPEVPDYPGLVFPYHGKPIANYYILDRFQFGLDRLKIDHETRRLTVHCLRYTYNTRMRTLLSEQVLREFVGHRSVAMTDHYDNPILAERLIAYQGVRPSVEQFWGKSG